MPTQDEELDEEFEVMAATAMLHHMPPTQAMDQAALLVSIHFQLQWHPLYHFCTGDTIMKLALFLNNDVACYCCT